MQQPPRVDPLAAPLLGRDSHLPAVPPQRLHPEALRHRFAKPPAWAPELSGDGRFVDREPAAAAVLVPLILRAEGLSLLLTQRTAHLKDHAGQVSFPGGRSEPHDADATATALREAEEELGLRHRHVQVIGTLPIYTTVTRFVVTPVVALVSPEFDCQPDPFEVAEVFEVPLEFLMNPAHHQHHAYEWRDGDRREFLAMPWHPPGRPEPYFIWGATAAMLRNLYRFLSA